MKCQECEAAGKASKVSIRNLPVTDRAWRSFYDEDGRLHRHNPNYHSQRLTCSNGHSWAVRFSNFCPTCGELRGEGSKVLPKGEE